MGHPYKESSIINIYKKIIYFLEDNNITNVYIYIVYIELTRDSVYSPAVFKVCACLYVRVCVCTCVCVHSRAFPGFPVCRIGWNIPASFLFVSIFLDTKTVLQESFLHHKIESHDTEKSPLVIPKSSLRKF